MRLPKGSFRHYPTHTMPLMLDVVWCKFPEHENPDRPGPKPRPALVRSVSLYAQQTRVAVEVVYGTSKLSMLHQLDLRVSSIEDLHAAGLTQPTGFRLARSILLPWCEEFFSPPDGKKTPVIGRLGPASRIQLEVLKVMRRGKTFD